MAPVNTFNASKTFSDNIILDLYNVTIHDCQTKTCNVSAKEDSEKEITVSGDYEVQVYYSKSSEDRKTNFEVLTVRRDICEIVPFHENETFAVLSFQTSCELGYSIKSRRRSLWEMEVQGWEIEVLGEINITGTLNNAIEPAESTNIVEKQVQKTRRKQFDSQVWQFEEIDGITMEQLMGMDLESLKKLAK